MEERYNRNRIYIDFTQQELLKNKSILLAGAGIGSVIAECMLRLGFEKFTIIDGDVVEMSNLNRQNYKQDDINTSKVESIKTRLLSINKNAQITIVNSFLTTQNIEKYISNHDIAINALDFDTKVPLIFDELCIKKSIPVLHPYNLGWGALVFVINKKDKIILKDSEKINEVNIIENLVSQMRKDGKPEIWLENIIEKYKNEKTKLSPPQLSIGSWLVASMCTQIAYDIIVKNPVKIFPKYYYLTSKSN